jgi:hypothetical protein
VIHRRMSGRDRQVEPSEKLYSVLEYHMMDSVWRASSTEYIFM